MSANIYSQLRQLKERMKTDVVFKDYYQDSSVTIYEWYEGIEKKIRIDYYNSVDKIKSNSGFNEIYLEGLGLDAGLEFDFSEIINHFKEDFKNRTLFKVAMNLNTDFLK